MTGNGCEANFLHAKSFFEELAAEAQPDFVNCDSLTYLGMMHERGGYGLAQNQNAAVDYYLSGADSGSPAAMLAVARIYWSGSSGMTKNVTEAEKYFVRAIAAADRVTGRADIPEAYKVHVRKVRSVASDDLSELRSGRKFLAGLKIASGVLGALTAVLTVADLLDKGGDGKA